MKRLRSRIIRLFETGTIADDGERQKLDYLVKTKKWYPYTFNILQFLYKILHDLFVDDSYD